MARTGHGSTKAALMYQHTAQEQDKGIADALSARIARERDRARTGTQPERIGGDRWKPRSGLVRTWALPLSG